MKRLIAAIVLIGGLALSGCHSTNPIVVCSETKPTPSISLRGARSSGGLAVCDGVTANYHYFWHIRYSDHVRTYLHFVPR